MMMPAQRDICVGIRGFYSKNKDGVVLSALIVASLISLSVSTQSFIIKPKEIGLSIVSVFQIAFQKTGDFFSKTITSIKELGELRSEYDLLLKKIEDSEALKTDIVELQEENEQLRDLLNFSERIKYKNLPARVIGKDPGNLFATITLNKGKRHGVKADMPVVAVQDHSLEENDLVRNIGLVGKVLYAGAFTSVVQPLFDRNYFAAARLQRTRYEGLVEGSGSNDLNVTMRYVNKDARNYLRHGDLVITSGMNSIYPKGIHIGTVSVIQGKPYESSLDLEIGPVIDFSRLEYVFILDMADGE